MTPTAAIKHRLAVSPSQECPEHSDRLNSFKETPLFSRKDLPTAGTEWAPSSTYWMSLSTARSPAALLPSASQALAQRPHGKS